MLSIQNNRSWETLSVRINNKDYDLPEAEIEVRKIVFLLTKMMESIYFRLWDLVTQSKYDDTKKSKMKTELKRITIGTVEKCLLAMINLERDKIIVYIGRMFTEEEFHFVTKIKNYAN